MIKTDQIKRIYDLKRQLKTNRQISEITGTKLPTVRYWISRYKKDTGTKLPSAKSGRRKINIINL